MIRNILAPNTTRDNAALSHPGLPARHLFPRPHPGAQVGPLPSVNDNPTNELRRIRLRDDVRLFSNSGTTNNVDDDTYDLDVDFPTDTNIAPGQKRRPLFASGSTPIYKSVLNFRTWYNSWKAYAREYDVDWQCRPKYLLFLTDGDETCDSVAAAGAPKVCEEVRLLAQTGTAEDRVKTYVVGFGLPGGSDALTCMAVKGLTERPLLPRNKTELVDALTDIFNSIRTESFAFASASIPAVQSTAADKIYLSSFTPIQARSVWPGRLDAFRQPLPLTKDGKPDVTFSCAEPGRESGCHLWDAADKLLSQAPNDADVNLPGAPNLKLGMGFDSQRRVLYGQANPAGVRKALRLMLPPSGYSDAEPQPRPPGHGRGAAAVGGLRRLQKRRHFRLQHRCPEAGGRAGCADQAELRGRPGPGRQGGGHPGHQPHQLQLHRRQGGGRLDGQPGRMQIRDGRHFPRQSDGDHRAEQLQLLQERPLQPRRLRGSGRSGLCDQGPHQQLRPVGAAHQRQCAQPRLP